MSVPSKIEKQQEFMFLKLKDRRFSAYSYWDQIPGDLVCELLWESNKYDALVNFKRMTTGNWATLLSKRVDLLSKCSKKLTVHHYDNIISSNGGEMLSILSSKGYKVSELRATTVAKVCSEHPEIYDKIKKEVDLYLLEHSFESSINFNDSRVQAFLRSVAKGWVEPLKNTKDYSIKYDGLTHLLMYSISPSARFGLSVLRKSNKPYANIKKFVYSHIFPVVRSYLIGDSWVDILKKNPKLKKHVGNWNQFSKSGLRSICDILDDKSLKEIYKTLIDVNKQAFVVKKPHLFINNKFMRLTGSGELLSSVLLSIRFLEGAEQRLAQRKLRNALSTLPDRQLGFKIRRISEQMEYEDSKQIEALLRCIPKSGVKFLSEYDLNHVYRVCPFMIELKLNMRHLK